MTVFARVVALALLSTLASAGDQWGLFCCPANMRGSADSSVSYANAAGIAAISTKFLTGGPYAVITGAESEEGRIYSCMTLTPVGNRFGIEYWNNGIKLSTFMTWDPVTAELKGKLPRGMFNSPGPENDVKFTVTSYKDGYVAMKNCKNGILSNFVATYVLIDKTVDRATLDLDCVGPKFDLQFRIGSWLKGLCT